MAETKLIPLTDVQWLSSDITDPVLVVAVEAARTKLQGENEITVRGIWNTLDEIFQRWKNERGQEPCRGMRRFSTAPPYLCAGPSVQSYAHLFLLLLVQQYPPLIRAFGKPPLLKLLSVIVLHDAFSRLPNGAHFAYQFLSPPQQAFQKAEFSGLTAAIQALLPHATRGKKVLNAAKRAHAAVHGSPEEKQVRWQNYQLEVDRLHNVNPRMSFSDIKKRVAKKFRVSLKTIQRRTTNPKRRPAVKSLTKIS